MIAATYARKSTDDPDRDAEARSCERQIEGAKRYAADHGWKVGPIFRDDAVSWAEWNTATAGIACSPRSIPNHHLPG